MAQTRTFISMLLCLTLYALTTTATPLPSVLVDDPPIFPLKDIRRGQKGEGYTVFASADGPERFEFTILGVMKNYLGPGEDLIIAKLEGDKIERTGVISGMSGSPAFIDGKLVGAVGYRFGSFTKDPIAGITPIERMLTVADAPKTSPPGHRPTAASSSVTFGVDLGAAAPISIPLMTSGLAPGVVDTFGDALSARGYTPVVAGGGGGASSTTGKPTGRLFPAGPVAGLLVSGDQNMAAIGTVTWVKGNRFLAFGHPFNGTGLSKVPVADAEIVTTVASQAGSWKMGQATTLVGRLTDDRLHAISGTMGERAPTIPVRFRFTTDGARKAADPNSEVNLQVISERKDAPLFSAISLANTLSSRVSAEEGGTVSIKGIATFTVGPDRRRETLAISISESMDATQAVYLLSAISLLGVLNEITDHDFDVVELAGLDLQIDVSTTVRSARIVAVDALGPLVSGKSARLRVRLRALNAPVVDRVVTVRIPGGLAPGMYGLAIVDARAARRIEHESGLRALPQSSAAVFDDVRGRAKSEEASVYLVKDGGGMRIEGRTLTGLPPSLEGVLSEGGGLSGAVVDEQAFFVERFASGFVLGGEVRAKVQVTTESM